MKKLTKLGAALICVLISPLYACAQAPENYPSTDSNKMFVVIAVLGVIFVGLAVFLFALEARVRKMEKKLNERLNN